MLHFSMQVDKWKRNLSVETKNQVSSSHKMHFCSPLHTRLASYGDHIWFRNDLPSPVLGVVQLHELSKVCILIEFAYIILSA